MYYFHSSIVRDISQHQMVIIVISQKISEPQKNHSTKYVLFYTSEIFLRVFLEGTPIGKRWILEETKSKFYSETTGNPSSDFT